MNSSKSTGIKSIQIKIALWAGICLFLAAAVIITYTGISLYNTTTKTAEAQVVALAQSQASSIDAEIETALDTARTLAQTMAALKSSGETLSREQVNAMLEQIMLGNPNFFGAYTLWEPDAFDGKDAEYANTPGHDATGRFLPYWFRSGNTVTTDVLLSEDMDVGDFYLIPKQTGKEAIIEPYFYPIAGKDVLMTSLVVPIMVEGRFYGVAGVDYRLDFLQELTDKARIYDGEGQLVLITYQGTLAGMTGHPQLVGKPAIEIHPDSAAELPDIQAGKRISQYWKNRLEIFEPIYFGRTDTPWSANILVPVETITAEANAVLWRMVGIGVILVGIALVLLWVVSGRIARPIKQITQTAQTIAAGELDVEAPVTSSDEVGVLAGAFNQMTTRLREMVDTVQTRSVELEERTKELEASQRVTFAASEHATPDELLDLVVNLIRDQFDLYHAQVYMVDEQEQAAVLRQSTGYAGRQLLQRKHRIPLDATALVTRAIHTGEAVLVDDVKADPNFLPNPLLPDTRSELVVPLKREGKVIGVLDAQDRNPGRFNPSTIALFQTMTDQVAILFENSELLQRVTDQTEVMGIFSNQLRTAADIARRLGTILDPEQLLQEVVELIQSRFGLYHAHIYLLNEEADTLKLATGSGEVGRVLRERGHSIPLNAEKSLVARAARSRSTILVTDTTLESDFMPNPLLPQTRSELSLPLVVGNTVLGVLDLQDDQAGRFTEAERDTFGTLAGLVATAIQNARLFEAQRRAQEVIRESEARYSAVVTQAQDGIVIVQDNMLQFANQALATMLGYTVEEMLNTPFVNYLPPEERVRVANRIKARLAGEDVPSIYESQLLRKDGTIIDTEFSAGIIEYHGHPADVGLLRDITERKKAEEQIRIFQSLAENAADAITMSDLEGKVIYANRAAYDMMGFDYARKEMLGISMATLASKDELERQAEAMRHILTEGGGWSGEAQASRRDGSQFDIAVTMFPVLDAAGHPLSIAAIIRDITDRKRTEAAIHESQQRLSLLVQQSPLAVIEWNTNFQVVQWNEAAEHIFGYTREEALGRHAAGLIVPEEVRDLVNQVWQDLLTQRGGTRSTNDNFTKDGRIITCEWYNAPLVDASGNVLGVASLVADITERKQAEQRIRDTQQLLQSFLDNFPDTAWLKDSEGRFLLMNRYGIEHLVGGTEADVLGKTVYDIFTKEMADPLWESEKHLLATGTTLSVEENVPHVDGQVYSKITTKFPLYDAQGNINGLGGVLVDITDRKRAEAEVQKRASELQTVAEVGTAAATILEPDRLLAQVVELTKSNFGLYHAHIYLIDELGESLVLAAGAGEAGKQMLAQGWKIAVDSTTSLVARAFRTREGVIVNDVRAAPDFLPNPLLPDTRSELAVPLIVGKKALGVLDVQSDQVDHFTHEDVAIQTTLAGQIASSLQNAQLFEAQIRSEQMTQEQRVFLRRIIDATPNFIFVKDRDGKFVLVNQAMANAYGTTVEELIGKSDADFNPNADEVAAFLAADRATMDSQQEVIIPEEPITDSTGNIRWLQTTKRALVGADGVANQILGISVDITERREREAAILQERNFSTAVINSLPGIFYVVDAQANLTRWNDRYIAVTGYTPEELAVIGALGPIAEEDRASVAKRIEQVFVEGEAAVEALMATKNGERIPYYLTGKRAEIEGKTYVVGMGIDITDRVAAERAVRESRRMLEIVMNSLPESIFWKDKDLVYLGCNTNFARDAGFESPEQVIGKTDHDMPWKDQVALYQADDRHVIETGEAKIDYEEPQSTADGGTIWLRTSKLPLYNEQGEAYAVLGAYADITEMKKAEQAVRESQQRLSLLVQQSPLAVIEWNTNFQVVQWNEAAEHIFGYTREEALGRHAAGLIVPEEVRDLVNQVWQDLLTQRGGTRSTNDNFTKDGRIITCEWYNAPLVDASGNVLGVASLVADITERKQAEQRIRDTQQLLQSFLDNFPDIAFAKDTKGRVILGNKALHTFFPTPDGELLGKTVYDLVPQDIADGIWQSEKKILETGETTDFEEIVPQHGVLHTKLTTKFPLYDAEGNITALGGVSIDITDRKRAEAEIQKRASELQTVAEVGTAAATILEPDRLLSQVVELTKSNFGLYHAHIYLIDELGESLVLAAGAGEAGKQMLAQGWKIAVDSTTSLVARAFRTRAGVIVNDVRAAPDFLPNPLLPETRAELAVPLIVGERVLGVLDVQSDQVDHFTREDVAIQTTLAGQIATAIENARLFQESRQVDRLKSEFLANMSHELRTPLNSIIGYIQLLLMDLEGEVPEESYEDMQSIDTNSRHLLNLINDILDLAKIEAGRVELHLEEMDVAALLDTVKNNNAGLFINSALSFNVSAEEGLPHINADPVRINQILNNLISNAFKFTETGGVTIHAYRDNNDVCIAVQDTGIGIAEKDLEAVFERFRQVDGSFTRRAEGTGLGLSITRLLVEMHKGRLSVRSKLGEGSTFTVHLPAVA